MKNFKDGRDACGEVRKNLESHILDMVLMQDAGIRYLVKMRIVCDVSE